MALSLSICIPTYNRAALLRETLERLERDQHCFQELVIVDDASPDDTPAVVEEFRARFPALRFFRHSKNQGPPRNYHACLALGTSDLLFMLSDDDALLPARIRDAVALLESDPASVAVYGGYERSVDNHVSSFYTAVPQRTGRFTAADVGLIAETGNLLTFPVMHRETFQRHCFYDDTSFGTLRLVAQLVGRGAVHVVDYPLYSHRDETVARLEMQLSEAWYIEYIRSDWETFVGMLGGGDLDITSKLAAGGVVPLYLMASQVERQFDRPLRERAFLIRFLAHTAEAARQQAADRIAEWENTRLIAATMERLTDRLALCDGLKRVVIEQGRLNILDMWRGLEARFPGVAALPLDAAAFDARIAEPGDFLLAEHWGRLAGRAPMSEQLAVGDIIASLRLPGSAGSPALQGPKGSMHVCLDPGKLGGWLPGSSARR